MTIFMWAGWGQAILYSFQTSSVAMVDHHTLMLQFWDWRKEELHARGYSPGMLRTWR